MKVAAMDTAPSLDRRMIFTPDRSVLYVSVPKTGCTTIKTVMAAASGLLDPAAKGFGRGVDVHGLWSRRPGRWCDLKPRHRKAMLRSGATFRFTSVRDPFERVVSCYLSKVANEASPHGMRRKVLMRGEMSLMAFLRFVADQPPMKRDVHCRRQVDLIFSGQVAYDLLIRHETFEADLGRVIARLDAPGLRIPPLNPGNVSGAKTRKGELLGPSERALAHEIYAADFETFGYSRAGA